MPETPERLAERLHDEGQKTAAFFHSLTPRQLEQQLYADGSQWSVRQLLAHFITAERGFYALLEDILAGGPGAAQDFDINTYNESQVAALQQASLVDLLYQFSVQRLATVELVQRMAIDDLSRMGRHPFLGVAPLEDMLKLIYRHNQIHQRDVRKLLAFDGEKG
jgi:hypothetical protein